MVIAINGGLFATDRSESRIGLCNPPCFLFHPAFFLVVLEAPFKEVANRQDHGDEAEQHCENNQVKHPVHNW